MKLVQKFLLIILILIFIIPQTVSASAYYYYPVVSEYITKTKPGIYGSTPNGKEKLIVSEKVYLMKTSKTGPMKLKDVQQYIIKDRVSPDGSIGYHEFIDSNPIDNVKQVGKDLYYTKVLFQAAPKSNGCRNYDFWVYEIYKRDSNGKAKKITADRISSNTKNAFEIVGSHLYYAKINNQLLNNFSIIRASLDGKNKKTLQTGVSDFWVYNKHIYYIKSEILYRMNLDGTGKKAITSSKDLKLSNESSCNEANYTYTKGGLLFNIYDKGNPIGLIFFDFKTLSKTKLPKPFINKNVVEKNRYFPIEIDTKNNLIYGITQYVDNKTYEQKFVIGIYTFQGKLVKKISSPYYINFLRADSKNRQVIYYVGKSLKSAKF